MRNKLEGDERMRFEGLLLFLVLTVAIPLVALFASVYVSLAALMFLYSLSIAARTMLYLYGHLCRFCSIKCLISVNLRKP